MYDVRGFGVALAVYVPAGTEDRARTVSIWCAA
jgi:hypothetical protein